MIRLWWKDFCWTLRALRWCVADIFCGGKVADLTRKARVTRVALSTDTDGWSIVYLWRGEDHITSYDGGGWPGVSLASRARLARLVSRLKWFVAPNSDGWSAFCPGEGRED